MHVLIFGGNRYVGRRVAASLVANGEAVTLVHRSAPSVPGVLTIRGDRAEPAVLSEALSRRPDVILDMSLYTGVAARALMKSISGASVRYVAVSTAAIYSQSAPLPWDERTPIDPAPGWGMYGIGKAEADAVVQAAGLRNGLVVRPGYIIGSGDPDRRCELVFSRAESGETLEVPATGSAMVQVIDADDMADILTRLLVSRVVGVMDIPGARVSVKGFIEQCASLLREDYTLRSVPADSSRYLPAKWPFPDLNLCVEGERFRRECPSKMKSLAEMLGKALEERNAKS